MARDVFTNRGFQNDICNAKPVNRTRGVDESWFPRPDLQCKVNELHERCPQIAVSQSIPQSTSFRVFDLTCSVSVPRIVRVAFEASNAGPAK